MQEFIVSNLEDENDSDFSEGDLSLREAIAIAESGDLVTFSSNLRGGTINLSLGELVIDKNLTINGLGADQLTIDAGGENRIFNLDDGNGEVNLDIAIDGLAITGADISRKRAENSAGGGIFSSENLKLSNSLVSGNIAGFAGGGIYSSGGSLSISNSTIDDNSASRPTAISQSIGGGIATLGTTVEINDSQITNNTASLGGGGIEVRNSSSLTISDSNITDNFGLNAGGINSANSRVNIQNSSVSNNGTGFYEGSGAISSDSDSLLTIDHSIIDSNSGADGLDRGPAMGGPLNAFAAGIGARGTTTISNSTISNNIALRGDREDIDTDIKIGHGIRNTGTLNITNSTFIGNTDEGIKNEGGSVNIANSTIVDDITGFSVGNPEAGSSVTSSIIVINDSGIRPTVDSNQNLIANYDDIGLGELQDNGGSTLTVALLEGSLAINAGSNDLNLVNDQRGEGFSRTVGAATDIGAFEFQDGNSQVPDVQVPDIQIPDDDLIFGGGGGADTLIGGAGHDVFVLEASDIHDMIVDFELGSDRLQLSESLSLGQLSIVDNESNTGSLIIDSNNHDAVIASVENVHAANLSIHPFC